MRIVFATHNAGKVKEVREILTGLRVEIVGADEAGITEVIPETGETFQENALQKASFVWDRLGGWVMADDSGICATALYDRPGVYSARWTGENAPAEKWVEKMLEEMRLVPEERRTAYFKTAAVLRNPDGRCWVFLGVVDGTITTELRGIFHPKLPYDVLFIPVGYDRTFAEMTAVEKNAISHRGRAFTRLRQFLLKYPRVR